MRIRAFALTSAAAAATLALTGVAYVAAADTQDEPYQVFMSPEGSNDNDGTSLDDAVASLEGAESVLEAADPSTDVEILIDKGTYVAGTTKWQFTVPGQYVTFKRLDSDTRPVFDGDGAGGYWLSVSTPEGEDGGNSNLRFSGLKVEGYTAGGLQFHGNTKESDGFIRGDGPGVNNNTVSNMWFADIGSAHAGSKPGYGAINLWNSSNNTFRGNSFTGIENASPDGGMMHGIYAAHHSGGNEIYDSRFEDISGDPVRVRNDSNDNEIHDNTFTRTGVKGQYSDWFCHEWCADHHDSTRECASHGNTFHKNDNVSGYDGGVLGNWAYVTGSADTTGGEGCSNEGQDRVTTWGNT